MNSPYGIIYKATCILNDTVYIGQTITSLEKRISVHKAYAKTEKYKFAAAIKEHGFEMFNWEIIDNGKNEIELNDKEEYYIEKYIDNSYNVVQKLLSKNVSTIRCLYENEKLTQTEICRLMGLKSVRKIVYKLTRVNIKASENHNFTKEQIQKVKQETKDIQDELNNNRTALPTETKKKQSKFSDKTIGDIKWFLENTDMTSPELEKLFNYTNMSDLRNDKTRTWIKASESVSKELLKEAKSIKKKRKDSILEEKVPYIKKIMNDKLLNQSKCAKIFDVSQGFIWKIINNKTYDYVKPANKLTRDINKRIKSCQRT